MERTPWGSRIFLCYLLYQIPGWSLWSLVLLILRQWFVFPWWLIPGALAVWVAKDLILFPYVWRAYDSRSPANHPLAGSRGVVVKTLSPEGYIRIQGELWRAETAEQETSIPPGETVTVEGIKGLTLLVRPSSGDTDSGADPLTAPIILELRIPLWLHSGVARAARLEGVVCRKPAAF